MSRAFQMMKRKQREMQENGGSPGCPNLVVSRSLAENFTKWTCMDAHSCTCVPFYEVENNCGYHLFESDHEEEEEEATEKKEEDEPTKKKSAFHVRSMKKSSRWFYSVMAFDLIHLLLTLVKTLVWCHFPAGIQCLGHQLEEGSEGPEQREKGNK